MGWFRACSADLINSAACLISAYFLSHNTIHSTSRTASMILKPFCIWGPSHGCYRAHNLGNLITRSTVSNLLPVTVYAYMSVSEYLCTLYISQVRIPYLFKSIVVLKHDTISMRCGESGPKLASVEITPTTAATRYLPCYSLRMHMACRTTAAKTCYPDYLGILWDYPRAQKRN